MINLRVLVPEATINYITNPAFRYDTTGWNLVGSTITRTLDYARFGIASLKVVTTGASVNQGAYYRVSSLLGISEPISASIYVRGEGRVRLRLINNPTGMQFIKDDIILRLDRWQRVEIQGFSTGSNDMRLYVETTDVADATTFYLDGAQMERKAYVTSYCDGDQPGCRWNIVDSASNSSRTADTREGGKWVSLAGPCRPDNDIYVTVLGGFGKPPVTNNIQPWANAPGSYFQNQKILDRIVTLNFTVKKEDLRPTGAPSLKSIHGLRQQLVDLFKTDKTLNDEAFWFEYSDTDADKPLYIRFRYEAGLDGDWDIRNGWYNSFAVRLIAVDPLWREDSQDVKQLGIKTTYNSATPMEFWGKISGVWNKLQNQAGITLQGRIERMAVAPDGTIYICGAFSNNGFNGIVKWDGTNFLILSNGLITANSIVYDISIAPDGKVYAVGDFTSIGGVAANGVAVYNPVTDTWSALGTGLAGGIADGHSVCVAPNGQVYVGGSFTAAGGVTANNLARWDGGQWRTVGALSGVADIVYCIIDGKDGNTLYIGGGFAKEPGATNFLNCVAQVDITTNLISAMGYGFDTGTLLGVRSMAVGLDGTVYAGGDFVASGSPNADPLFSIAKWSGGNIWEQLGDGLNGRVEGLAIGKDGTLYAVGGFIASGLIPMPHVAKWFGGVWTNMEIYSSPNLITVFYNSIITDLNGDIYIGTDSIGIARNVSVPKLTTVTNNGSTSCWPTLYIKGQGTVRYIANVKTGQEIFLDLDVFSGEEVFIDFARGKITGTVRGDLNYTILPGSEIRSIFLLPGDNIFSVLVTDDVAATMQIEFTPQHWSADAISDTEAL